ncbi:hypothetical protein A1O3_03103 [Capronia epimyces CBS 606.96]|uniref:AB hydrolase-1 domain-containing protein n=1 Tax=Capronia epimyces CBS 606.96 TaxID=1182542 RepID=W9YK28_9EURO|nr:uncharacterized protein A1O3_03103 [Capronia epimyces CBS 606.96]EXJ90035.1 hypothetical protein A1O3_03103 [Capronia epimyces CBS 606.96]
MADDVRHFIKKHFGGSPSNQVTLIGHSMGAKTALTLALESPELVADVVAIDNAPIRLPLLEDFDRYIEAMRQIERARVTTLTQADEILKEYEKSSQIRLFLLTNLTAQPKDKDKGKGGFLKFRVPIDVLARALGPLGDFPFPVGGHGHGHGHGQGHGHHGHDHGHGHGHHGHGHDTPRFDKPTLFIRALRSHYIPDWATSHIDRYFPNSTVVDIDCGHWIVQEKPREFQEVTIDFLTRNLANPGNGNGSSRRGKELR